MDNYCSIRNIAKEVAAAVVMDAVAEDLMRDTMTWMLGSSRLKWINALHGYL